MDIYYNLGGYAWYLPASVSVEISSDGGATRTVPASSLTGDVGDNVTQGLNRRITWDAGTDWIDQFSAAMQVKVSATIADAPLNMARIPAGSFAMGDTLNEGEGNELPVRSIYVKTFFMDKCEVASTFFWEVVRWAERNGYNPGYPPDSLSYNRYHFWWTPFAASFWHPINAQWSEVVMWCNARSEMEGLTPCYTKNGAVWRSIHQSGELVCDFSASGYRLPTEAEWEKAARGGLINKRFPWGDTITHNEANYESLRGTPDAVAYDVSPTTGRHPSYLETETAPVGSFAPNGYGLHDMAGNILEWCWDTYSDSYDESSANVIEYERVARGGSFGSSAKGARVSARYSYRTWFVWIGFRCVRSSVP